MTGRNVAVRIASGFAAIMLLALQTDCASNTAGRVLAGPSRCVEERRVFETAARPMIGWSMPADAYWATVAAPPTDSATVARRVASDIDADVALFVQLQSDYAGLRQCRTAHAESGYVEPDLALARQAIAAGTARVAVRRAAADRVMAEAPPASRSAVAEALSSPPLPPAPYVATSAAVIHARPDSGSAVIADIRKGARVTGPHDASPIGWTILTLNDGSFGFVESDVLRPGSLNRSAQQAAEQARRIERYGSDPIVALAIAARRTLPERSAAFAALVDSATIPSVALGSGTSNSTAR
jgi:hypothetical protein